MTASTPTFFDRHCKVVSSSFQFDSKCERREDDASPTAFGSADRCLMEQTHALLEWYCVHRNISVANTTSQSVQLANEIISKFICGYMHILLACLCLKHAGFLFTYAHLALRGFCIITVQKARLLPDVRKYPLANVTRFANLQWLVPTSIQHCESRVKHNKPVEVDCRMQTGSQAESQQTSFLSCEL